jgi:hypothetical protein
MPEGNARCGTGIAELGAEGASEDQREDEIREGDEDPLQQ